MDDGRRINGTDRTDALRGIASPASWERRAAGRSPAPFIGATRIVPAAPPVLLALLLAAVLSAACGQQTASAAAKTVAVTLSDQSIQLSDASVTPSRVTFSVTNKGSVVHSLVLLKTDVPQDKLPTDTNNPAKVQETGIVATTGQVGINETRAFTRDLVPGNYVLLCNEPGHYLGGMHIAFTVK